MVNYVCKPCNFKSINKSDYTRHIKTKKHKKNCVTVVPDTGFNPFKGNETAKMNSDATRRNATAPKKRVLCEYCNYECARLSSLTRHLKNCYKKEELDRKERQKKDTEDIMREQDRIIEKLKLQLSHSKQMIKKQQSETNYYKKLINNYSTLGHKTFSSLTFIMNNYQKAPHLQKIEPEKIECFKESDKKFVEKIVNDYKHKKFVDFIIDAIKKIHQKDNPEDQSIWSTDTSRYNYIIKELLENKGSYWVVDKKGVKSKDYLVEPILKFIKQELMNYNTKAYESIDELTQIQKNIILETQRLACEMLQEIEDGSMSREIVRKLAKHLFHKGYEKIEDIEGALIEEVE